MDNSAAFLLPGVWSSRMYLKQANRRLEHLLTRKLEPLLAMTQAFLPPGSFRYPQQELDLAWKLLLLNHPHDSICGCSVDAVHRENMSRFEQVEQIVEALIVRAEHALSVLGGEDEWVVCNTGHCAYTGVVRVTEKIAKSLDEIKTIEANFSDTALGSPFGEVLEDSYLHDTHKIPLSHLMQYHPIGYVWVDNVLPDGIRIVSKQQAKTASFQGVRVAENSMENEYLLVWLEQNGTWTVKDKRTGIVHKGLLSFLATKDKGDSYNSNPVSGIKPIAQFDTTYPAAINDGEDNALVGMFYGEYYFEKPQSGEQLLENNLGNIGVYVQLFAGSPSLEFELRYDLDVPTYHKIQAIFPTGRAIEHVAAESHLSVSERAYDPNYAIEEQPHAGKMQELKTNTGAIQRFISANGQTIITEGLTEYEVCKDTLLITLFRPFYMLSSKNLETRGAPAGPPMETLDALRTRSSVSQLCAWQRFAWMPTPQNPANLYEAAGRFYGNVWGLSGTGTQKTADANSLISWDNPALVSSACYWLPNRGLILRLINTTDRELSTTFTVGFKHHAIHETNMLEEIQRTLSDDTATIGPRDVKTLLFALPPQTGV
jgi:hypothetical protein